MDIDYTDKATIHEGVKAGAFLLVIPGFALMGAGIGLALQSLIPGSIIGLGAGMAAWGLVVVFRKREI